MSTAAVRVAICCLVLISLSTFTMAAVGVVSYLFPRGVGSSRTQVIPSANSFDPTTVPTSTPSPASSSAGATQGTGSYQTAMRLRAGAFRAAYSQVVKDSLAAEKRMLDPRWPGILEGDADAVVSAAGEISAVKPPLSLLTADTAIDAACQAVIAGAGAFKDGVASLSSSKSEVGYQQMAAARDQLEKALKLLPV